MILNQKTLDCDGACDLMFDYIDGMLRESDVLRLEAHLNTCEACRRELEERRAMLSVIASCAYKAPHSLYDSVMSKIENVPQDTKVLTPKSRFKPWMGALTAVCAAVMILVVGRGFLSGPLGNADSAIDNVENAHIDAAVANSPTTLDTDILSYAQEHDTYSETYSVKSASDDGMTADKYIETTTDSIVAMTPTQGKNETLQTDVPEIEDAASDSSLDSLFDKISVKDTAVLVCRASDFDGILPDAESEKLNYNGDIYERYVIGDDAMVTFTGYLELLEQLGVDYRAAVPTDAQFDSFEILLLIDGEN